MYTLSRLFLVFSLFSISFDVFSQSELLPLSQDINTQVGRSIYFNKNKTIHTALQPYVSEEVADTLDLLPVDLKPWQKESWLSRKIFSEHLIEVKKEDYSLYFNFLPDFQIGKQGDNTTWLNTRGVELKGKVGKQFAFDSYFYENQGKFADYYTQYVYENRIVPGQAYAKTPGKHVLDYAYSGGSISYAPSKYVHFQLGYDKNFIGDGYRSMLLSDNAFNYPFFKITASLGSLRYMAMWSQFLDFKDQDFDDETPFPKKNGIFHYLSWNATSRFSVGLFENVMWRPRGFEFSYINPIMFLRPVEMSNGSPDKVLLGATASYKIADRYVAYGQFMLNEFTFKEVFANTGYWANKQGGQLGIKGFDIFKVDNLSAQFELNVARPYSYSANDAYKNYGHANQSLAHPYGANFREFVSIFNYRYRRFDARLQADYALYGLDVNGLNYGKDIYKDYGTRVDDYGVFIGHGLKTNLTYVNTRLAYILNPKTNLRLELGYTSRLEKNSLNKDKQNFFTVGLRSSFRNLYQDF